MDFSVVKLVLSYSFTWISSVDYEYHDNPSHVSDVFCPDVNDQIAAAAVYRADAEDEKKLQMIDQALHTHS